jgi:hypothetical protein
MRELAEELYERTKDMISDIALTVMDDYQIPHTFQDQVLASILNEYYTLWDKPIKLEYRLDDAKELISRIETDNADTLHNKKLSDKSRLSIVVLYRSTLAYIFYKYWNMSQTRVGSLFNRDRSTVSYMVATMTNNIWYYNKQDSFERRVIQYLFEEAGLESPFDFMPIN